MSRTKQIIVDAANIAWEEKNNDGKPKLANILAVKKELERMGYEPIVIADASLRYDIDDPSEYEELEEKQILRQVPADTDADQFVLEFAARFRAPVVSNDQFREYEDRYPWIRHDRVKVMIINGKVEFQFPNGRGGG